MSLPVRPTTIAAIFSQWQHSENTTLYYARWNSGEVDIVSLDETTQKPWWAVEVKWSDRALDNNELLDHCVELANRNPEMQLPIAVTTRTITARKSYKGSEFNFQPSSLYAYLLGKNILHNKNLPEA